MRPDKTRNCCIQSNYLCTIFKVLLFHDLDMNVLEKYKSFILNHYGIKYGYRYHNQASNYYKRKYLYCYQKVLTTLLLPEFDNIYRDFLV